MTDTLQPGDESADELIAQIWADVLGCEVAPPDSFFELGGDSIQALTVVALVSSGLGRDVPHQSIFEHPTLGDFADSITAVGATTTARRTPSALVDDIVLEFPISSVPPSGEVPQHLFVTGALSFLGAHVTRALLDAHPDTDLHCLVPHADPDVGRAAVADHLARYGLLRTGDHARVAPVTGRLSRPRFGLSESAFAQLGRSIDAVYHLGQLRGAYSDSYLSYDALRPVNVVGTHEAVRLAAEGRRTPLHVLSHVNVMLRPGLGRDAVGEDDDLGPELLTSGFEQTMWVAEGLALAARAQGLPVSIYRVPDLIGDSATGMWDTQDPLCRTAAACVRAGVALKNWDRILVSPVDRVAAAIVHLSTTPEAATGSGATFHVVPGAAKMNWPDFAAIARAAGHPVRAVGWLRWNRALKQLQAESNDGPALAVPKSDVGIHRSLPELWQLWRHRKHTIELRTDRTTPLLRAAGLDDADVVTEEAMQRTLAFLAATGMIDPPQHVTATASFSLPSEGALG